MKLTTKNLTPLLATLLLLSLVSGAVPSLSPVSAAQDGQVEASLHRLHFDYDKGTGRWLVGPAVRAGASSTTAVGVEVESLLARKTRQVDPARITFRSGITVHPEPGMEPGAREALFTPGEPAPGRLWLIQFRYPFPTEARSRLQEAGVRFYDYVDVCGFFARVPAGVAPLLEQMLEEGVIRYVGGIPAEAKVQQELAAEAARRPAAEQEIVVLTIEEPAPGQLEQLGRLMSIEGQSTGPVHIVEGTAPGASILALANLDFVRWLEERSEATLGNLDGGMGVAADVVRAAGFDGTGVQVMVVDSGIARDGETYHPDLQGDRILDQWDYQADDPEEDPDGAADDNWLGHGTHVAGTIGGLYNAVDPDSNRRYQGLAPDAGFLIYKLFGSDNPFDAGWFQEAMLRATSEGRRAHVSNNSWGGGYGVYNVYSEIADAAVRGEYNGHPVGVVAAAMNDDRLVRAPGTGKNVITVGAVKDGNYPDVSLPEDPPTSCEDDDWPPGERVCYSNYGPIDTDGDGWKRVKPDLMAPGALITSAVPWYLIRYAGEYYGSLHGTSQATPHVTGAIAQLLDAYSDVDGGALVDWPEMVKAMLLATAVDVGGDDTAHYGHGLLDAYHAIYGESGVNEPLDVWGSSFSSSGQTLDFSFDVPAGYEQVRVVLTWADPVSSTEVINDLDVVWITDGGGAWRGDADSFDDTVEYARIPAGYASGNWTVRVRATSLVSPTQPFALAAHVILGGADLSIGAMPSSAPGAMPSFEPGGVFYLHQVVSNSGYAAGGSYAELQVPEGFTVRGATQYTQDGYGHWYEGSELHHDLVDDKWHVALGETLAGFARHVRWEIEIDEGMACGGYPFESTAYWLEGGSEQSSGTVLTQVPVVCHWVYLPLVLRDR